MVDDQGQSLEHQANALREHFERVSSSQHYSEVFLKHEKMAESKALSRKCTGNEQYNCPFVAAELGVALNSCEKCAPGTDQIMHVMIKHLHPDTQMVLLSLFNTLWATGYI